MWKAQAHTAKLAAEQALKAARDAEKAARQAEKEAQAAEKAALQHARETRQAVQIVTRRGLDAYPDLQQAILQGGYQAVDAVEAAIAAGQLVVRKPKHAAATVQSSREPRTASAPRTSGRVITQEEIDDVLGWTAAGQTAQEIGKVHGLHHVTVLAIASGRIKAKTA